MPKFQVTDDEMTRYLSSIYALYVELIAIQFIIKHALYKCSISYRRFGVRV